MARPVKRRTIESFSRDLEKIANIRIAILLDRSLEIGQAQRAVDLIDELTILLLKFQTTKLQLESANSDG